MKSVRLTVHATEQCVERGATEGEVKEAIERGVREAAKRGRFMYRLNFEYRAQWQWRFQQVAPLVAEEQNAIVVVTVYTFYF